MELWSKRHGRSPPEMTQDLSSVCGDINGEIKFKFISSLVYIAYKNSTVRNEMRQSSDSNFCRVDQSTVAAPPDSYSHLHSKIA